LVTGLVAVLSANRKQKIQNQTKIILDRPLIGGFWITNIGLKKILKNYFTHVKYQYM
jgi:predicted nucleic acid-binding protein